MRGASNGAEDVVRTTRAASSQPALPGAAAPAPANEAEVVSGPPCIFKGYRWTPSFFPLVRRVLPVHSWLCDSCVRELSYSCWHALDAFRRALETYWRCARHVLGCVFDEFLALPHRISALFWFALVSLISTPSRILLWSIAPDMHLEFMLMCLRMEAGQV
eukprot:6205217-Pleurochrysis_carterae.AAC.5